LFYLVDGGRVSRNRTAEIPSRAFGRIDFLCAVLDLGRNRACEPNIARWSIAMMGGILVFAVCRV